MVRADQNHNQKQEDGQSRWQKGIIIRIRKMVRAGVRQELCSKKEKDGQGRWQTAIWIRNIRWSGHRQADGQGRWYGQEP